MTQRYSILRGPIYTPSQFALAPSHARIEDAVADMGDGIVVRDDGVIAAFHERHLPMIERLAGVRSS